MYRTADGTCNNLRNSKWGSAFIPMRRFQPPEYADGVSEPRTTSVDGSQLPSARLVSREVHETDRGQQEMSSLTHMLMQWGQFVDHDITSAPHQTDPQRKGINVYKIYHKHVSVSLFREACFPIDVPPGDRKFRFTSCLNFVRSLQTTDANCRTEPVEQLNQITAYLDGSMVYGSSQEEQNNLRAFSGGRLKVSDHDLLPEDREESCVKTRARDFCFKAGDGRVNEQMGLASLHTVWMREHNRIADELVKLNPSWSDDKVFQEARKIVGALIQHITFTEWLPIILNEEYMGNNNLFVKPRGFYDPYNPNMDASIRNVFATAAFRFGHSLVNTFFSQLSQGFRDNGRHLIKEAFGRTAHILANNGEGVNTYIRGMLIDRPQKGDRFITTQLTDHLFEDTFGKSLDLASLNIQRGRDHGLPGYNVWRNWCGLSTSNSFQGMQGLQQGAAQKFSSLYRFTDDVDVFPGGLSEINIPGGMVGSTFACIIANQFRAIREGDRFWYERPEKTGFTEAQLNSIKRTGLSRVLCANTNIQKIQPNAFWQPTQRKPLEPCESYPDVDLTLWVEGNENGNGRNSNGGNIVPQPHWSMWGKWSECRNGIRRKMRVCLNGNSCQGRGSSSKQCIANGNQGQGTQGQDQGGWSAWSAWSDCYQSKQWRWRQCYGVPTFCVGPSASSRACGTSRHIPKYCQVPFFRSSGICDSFF
ncbi:hypothetical protein LOTGIDRAFT_115464 [Lottia gigantea]|uniref:Uncharacterized protein n=1 Tax=Lottia gigantea TaxID=225164 RepID=V4C5T3_LOTGI|nr:hypothetical protein LOTGIDRAFT_115464 [Lottia gigantea]ESO96969.1 hypothetical protein LOTGIDRAFT_115464 [Lottia gigantea]